MITCAACSGQIADEAEFCSHCGFRVEPISEEEHRRLTSQYNKAITEEDLARSNEGTAPDEQRTNERFPIKVEVDYTSDHNFFTGFLENISEGGLFIATHTPIEIGERFEVTFSVPGLSRTCVALCEVRWIRPFNALNVEFPPGVGCSFCTLDSDVRAAIELFIQHRQPIFYD